MKRRLRAEGGASLVEFALVFPIIITLLFGIIEFGFVFNSYLELRSGSREGARLAAVNNECGATSSGCVATAPNETVALIAKTRTRLNGLAPAAKIGVKVDFPALPDGSASPRLAGNDVRVCVYYRMDTVTGMFPFLNNKMLKSEAVMRLEQPATFDPGESMPAGVTTSPCT